MAAARLPSSSSLFKAPRAKAPQGATLVHHPAAAARSASLFFTRSLLWTAMGAVTWAAASPAHAQPASIAAEASRTIDIPAGDLDQALSRLGRQAGVQISVNAAMTAGLASPGANGNLSMPEAFRRILGGTGLEAAQDANGEYTVRRIVPRSPPQTGSITLAPVTVEGRRETGWGPVDGYLAKRSATGTKTDTPLIEVPQSISVVTADRVNAIGASTLKEALSYTPGVEIAPYGTDSRFDWITLRGFDAQTPGYYLDGLQLRNIDTWSVWRTENYGAERIEVLRGPSSVLYGQNGPGGLVNVVSKRPAVEPLREIQLQAGDHARRQIAGDVSGPVDGEGTLLYRLTGLVRDGELPAGGMPDDRIYIAPAFTWRPAEDTTLTLLSHYDRTHAGVYTRGWPEQGSLVPTPSGSYVPASTFIGEPGFDRLDQTQWTLGYLFEHRLDDAWLFRQNARYGRLKVDYRQISGNGFVTVDPNDATDPANYRSIDRQVFGSRETAATFALDNQAQAEWRTGTWRHKTLLGLDYQRTRVDQVTYAGSGVPPLDLLAPVYGASVPIPAPYTDAVTTVAQTGLYLQDQIKFDERWVATLGGRFDGSSVAVNNRLDGSRTRQTDHKFSGRAGLVYLHPDGWAPYLSYSESFFPTTAADPNTGKMLAPESGRQYEAGLRYQPPGQNDSYNLALFDLRRQNYVTYDTSFVPRQTGEVLVRGVELEATLQPTPRSNLTAAYAWMPKADVIASSNPDEIGKQLTAVSRHKLSLWADYRFASGVKIGVGARYVGTNRGGGEAAVTKVPAYTLLDAMVGYDFEDWGVALNARNLTDKLYITNCAYANCYYGDQRRVMVTLSRRW